MAKWQVVVVGRRPGVYRRWLEAAPQVSGVRGALWEGFPTFEEAEAAFEEAQARGDVRAVDVGDSKPSSQTRNTCSCSQDCCCRKGGTRGPRQPSPSAAGPSAAGPSAAGPPPPASRRAPPREPPEAPRPRNNTGSRQRPAAPPDAAPTQPGASAAHARPEPTAQSPSRVPDLQPFDEGELEELARAMTEDDNAHVTPRSRARASRSRTSSGLSTPDTGVSHKIPSERASAPSPARFSSASKADVLPPNLDPEVQDVASSIETFSFWVPGSDASSRRITRTESLLSSDSPSRQSGRNLNAGSPPAARTGSRRVSRTESLPTTGTSSPPTEVTQYVPLSLPPSPVRRSRSIAKSKQAKAEPGSPTRVKREPSIKEEAFENREVSGNWKHAEEEGAPVAGPSKHATRLPSAPSSNGGCEHHSHARGVCPTCLRPWDLQPTRPNTPQASPTRAPMSPALSALSPDLSFHTISSSFSPTPASGAPLPATPASARSAARVPLPTSPRSPLLPRSPLVTPSGRTRAPGTPLYPSLAELTQSTLGLTGLSQPVHAPGRAYEAALDPRSPVSRSTSVPLFAGGSVQFGRPTPPMPGGMALQS